MAQRELVDVRMADARGGTLGLLFPEAGTNVAATFGDPDRAFRQHLARVLTRRALQHRAD